MNFRNKMKEYLKDKINELAKNSRNKKIRDLHKGNSKYRMRIVICLQIQMF
jgi:hypothetical protein